MAMAAAVVMPIAWTTYVRAAITSDLNVLYSARRIEILSFSSI
jgi:hypothetical protein